MHDCCKSCIGLICQLITLYAQLYIYIINLSLNVVCMCMIVTLLCSREHMLRQDHNRTFRFEFVKPTIGQGGAWRVD